MKLAALKQTEQQDTEAKQRIYQKIKSKLQEEQNTMTSNNFYEVQGQKLLTEWNDYEKQTRIATKAAQHLQNQLIFEHGRKEHNAEFTFGLPYTSSGEFAAVWNCNASARKLNSRAYFAGIALTVDNQPIAFYKVKDENGNEIADLFEIIR